MSSPQIERKLAAIMFTDIAGYTALSAKDSLKASELLKTQKDTLKPIVEKHGGSWMKEVGDGLLLTFDSATSAVECSIAIQEATKDIEELNLRIGVKFGYQSNDKPSRRRRSCKLPISWYIYCTVHVDESWDAVYVRNAD